MEQKIKILPGRPYPMGVSLLENGNLNFAAAMHGSEECGLVLYAGRKEKKIVFRQEDRRGNLYCIQIQDVKPEELTYHFFEGGRRFVDPYAKALTGNEIWGAQNAEKLKGRLPRQQYDWEGDRPLMTPYEDSIFYLLHVRGFTRHASSGVQARGTFAGIVEKLPYLQELGVTAVELMPCYEFLEREQEQPFVPRTQEEAAVHAQDPLPEKEGKKPLLNYWGYKKGYYMAPKSSYSAGKDACTECRDMIKTLHRAGIEVILQFYFPKEIKPAYILEVLKYWVCAYHIDGVHLLGERIPTELLATEPMLENTKLLHHAFDCEEIYGEQTPEYRNLALAKDEFLYDCRHFLKGDAGMLPAFLRHMKENPDKTGIVNYMTSYYGFTLADLVAYDRKHNEANEEENRDGISDNVSWNCGAEGKTRKKSILRLREKQQKNALLFELLAQGTPLLLAGDEFGRTQNGNNNAYCQDNETGWVNWHFLERNQELYRFTRELIALRRAHPILHSPAQMKQMDYIACGYPDVSYHGSDAWQLKWEGESRQAGILYCGCYAKRDRKEDDDFFYLAYNMHWEPYTFALPELPPDRLWVKCLTTEAEDQTGSAPARQSDERTAACAAPQKDASSKSIVVGPRSVTVMIGTRRPEQKDGRKKEGSSRKRYEDMAAF